MDLCQDLLSFLECRRMVPLPGCNTRFTTARWCFAPIPGVAKVGVFFKDKTATIVYDDAKVDVNQLTSATTNAGYPPTPKS